MNSKPLTFPSCSAASELSPKYLPAVIRPHGLLSWPEPHASPVLPGEGTKVGWAESTEGVQGVELERLMEDAR